MTRNRWIVMIALGLLLGTFAAAQDAPPAPKDRAVPSETLKEITDQFVPPDKPMPRQEMIQLLTERMRKAVQLGQAVEDKHPQADNIDQVRMLMLRAAHFLASQQEEGAQGLLLAISQRVLDGKSRPEIKVEADRVVTTDRLKAMPADKHEEAVRGLASRYENTPVAWAALAYAADLAAKNRLPKVRDQMLDTLEQKHLEANPEVRNVLRKAGRKVDVGKPFEAELTRMDGTKLTLPKDLAGKVVVIDFWASWCPPCAASAPELKQVYDKVKGKGVEFVGISLDRDREALEKFIKQFDIQWVHTFSGKGWEDPTAARYGIRAIPAIWVLGRDGKVVSTEGRARLEEEIQKALDAKADGKTAPAEKKD